MSIWYGVISYLHVRTDTEGRGSRKDQWGEAPGPRLTSTQQPPSSHPALSMNCHDTGNAFSHSLIPPPAPELIKNRLTRTYCTSPWKLDSVWIQSRLQKLSWSFTDYQDIQAMERQWNPCGENSIKSTVECPQNKKGRKEQGVEVGGGEVFLLNKKARDLKLDCTITAWIPGNPDGELNT